MKSLRSGRTASTAIAARALNASAERHSPETIRDFMITLQRQAGNTAMAQWLDAQRAPVAPVAAAAAAPTTADVDDPEKLIDDLSVAIYEHEEGMNYAAKVANESEMSTSAPGDLRASFATYNQETMAAAITDLRRRFSSDELKALNLTKAMLVSADTVGNAAHELWSKVVHSADSETADSLLAVAANKKLLADSLLTKADVERMLQFRDFRNELRRALGQEKGTSTYSVATTVAAWNAKPEDAYAAAPAAWHKRLDTTRSFEKLTKKQKQKLIHGIPTVAREYVLGQISTLFAGKTPALKIGLGSIHAYVRKMWAEDQAAWQREAVNRLKAPVDPAEAPDVATQTIGKRIEAAATEDSGRTLFRRFVEGLVTKYIAHPPAVTKRTTMMTDEERIVLAVGRKQNPAAVYPRSVLAHFHHLRGTVETEPCPNHPETAVKPKPPKPAGVVPEMGKRPV